jgi:hypothetical protein
LGIGCGLVPDDHPRPRPSKLDRAGPATGGEAVSGRRPSISWDVVADRGSRACADSLGRRRGRIEAWELPVGQAPGAIDILAEAETELVLGSAVPHPHDLALGYYSVHTTPATLAAGERRIDEIRARLEREGRLRP